MLSGLSTHLWHGERLTRGHLDQIASSGFDMVEVFATRTHFDYTRPEHVRALASDIRAAGLTPWSLHAPICEGVFDGVWGRAYSNASPDPATREEAVEETRLSIAAAGALGCRVVVLHLGIPRGQAIPPGDNDGNALARSLEPIARACEGAGVQLALEVIPNDLATPPALLDWLDGDLNLGNAGVCLDFGHANLVGGAIEATEMLAGYLITTHVHDNRGTSDDHLVPFDGTIDWPGTLTVLAKIDYRGPLIFELPDHGNASRTLARAVAARTRIQAILKELTEPFGFELS